PGAALRANTAFAVCLQELKVRRECCCEILGILNMSRLTEPISYGRRNIEPSFFRLTAAWKDAPCPERLCPLLRNHGIEAEVLSVPVRLIYDQPAFLAQYGREVRSTPRCPVAEGQAAKRFAVRTPGTL
ncbi:MAG: hypothetical protein WBL65_10330, partial [Bryobacteraceae bacterium]